MWFLEIATAVSGLSTVSLGFSIQHRHVFFMLMCYKRWSHTSSMKNVTLQMFSLVWVIIFVNSYRNSTSLIIICIFQLLCSWCFVRKQLQFILNSFKRQAVAESNLLGQLHECFFGGGREVEWLCVYFALGSQKCHLTFPEIKEIWN